MCSKVMGHQELMRPKRWRGAEYNIIMKLCRKKASSGLDTAIDRLNE